MFSDVFLLFFSLFVHCFHVLSCLFTFCSLFSCLFISFHFLHFLSLEKNITNPDHLHVYPPLSFADNGNIMRISWEFMGILVPGFHQQKWWRKMGLKLDIVFFQILWSFSSESQR